MRRSLSFFPYILVCHPLFCCVCVNPCASVFLSLSPCCSVFVFLAVWCVSLCICQCVCFLHAQMQSHTPHFCRQTCTFYIWRLKKKMHWSLRVNKCKRRCCTHDSSHLGGHAAAHNKPTEEDVFSYESISDYRPSSGVLASLHQKLGLKPSRAPPTHTHTISTVQSQHALAQHWVITLTAVKQKRWKERQRAWISAMSFLVVS